MARPSLKMTPGRVSTASTRSPSGPADGCRAPPDPHHLRLLRGRLYGDGTTIYSDLDVSGLLEISGPIRARHITVGSLTIHSGGTLSHPSSGSSAESLSVTVTGDVMVEDGGSISATGRGYPAGATYPGAILPGVYSAGSHLGVGGGASSNTTFGSVVRPSEAGDGGQSCCGRSGARGGGIIRIDIGGTLVCNGSIQANGGSNHRGGAGGSIWISVTGDVSGTGPIQAHGGTATGDYSGGGGALALEHGGILSIPETAFDASGGTTNSLGGAGTIFLKGPDSTFGDLIVDNRGTDGPSTVLPDLGSGIAQAGSSGVTLVTDKTSIPAYFVGHWVEVSSPDGNLKGTWQVVAVDGSTLTLVDGATIVEDDSWQGVYRFDKVTIRASGRLSSSDPIRTTSASFEGGSTGDGTTIYSDLDVSGLLEISGPIRARHITAGSLTIHSGGTLSHPSSGSSAESLSVTVTGDVTVEDGGSISATGRGYPAGATYPGAILPGVYSAGSHLGVGGGASSNTTFGSVVRPSEAGDGGQSCCGRSGARGGGIIRIDIGGTLVCNGSIQANGGSNHRGGAGGSIWISVTGDVSGTGPIQAHGGTATGDYSGGGGALALEHGGILSIPETAFDASGGTTNSLGGAGTIFLKGPDSTFGDLIVDNRGGDGSSTVLPALGSGIAQTGSSGITLVTDKTSIPVYFVGHWVEISSPDGNLKGTWQVVAVDGSTLTLDGGATVAEGDSWQGVYRFDKVTIRASGRLSSSDPIRTTSASFEGGSTGDGTTIYSDLDVSGLLEISGPIRARHITAGSLTVHSGGTLSHPSSDSSAESLTVTVTGDVTVEEGGSISVSGRGYPEDTTYPGATPAGQAGGGSHLGHGGGSAGATYGSVTRPQEAGGGGARQSSDRGEPGGGVLRLIVGGNLHCDGTVGAHGYSATSHTSGAGGSIWLTVAGDISGLGVVEAKGGSAPTYYRTSGGGGAIALEYGGTLTLPEGSLNASGGAPYYAGGAGTLFLKGPDSTFGDLIVDNRGGDGSSTVLPALGSGIAQTGSSGITLVTDKTSIPAYFVGHWVEVSSPDGNLKGTWQVVAVDGSTLTLDGGATVAEGDSWQGVYRFDKVTIRASGRLSSSDPIRTTSASFEGGSTGDGTTIYSDLDVSGLLEISGPIRARHITAGSLTVHSGGTLSHPSSDSSAESLTVTVTGDVTVEEGGSISVSGRGYPEDTTYPGATPAGQAGGGSHLGHGGGSAGATYGSVTRPQEAGGGGARQSSDRGAAGRRCPPPDRGRQSALRRDGRSPRLLSNKPHLRRRWVDLAHRGRRHFRPGRGRGQGW